LPDFRKKSPISDLPEPESKSDTTLLLSLFVSRGVATGVDIGIYTPLKKSAQVNFLWGKNDVRTAIQQFYTPPPPKKKTTYTPKTNFWLCPCFCADGLKNGLCGVCPFNTVSNSLWYYGCNCTLYTLHR